MVCPRCGAAFEGNFCPNCGAPAAAAPPPMTFSVTCPRCGMAYQGRFCPRCGLPAGAMPYAPLPVRSGSPDLHRFLSVLWTLAVVGFLVFIALNFAGLLLSPPYVVPGIQGFASGRNPNPDLATGSAGWSFQALNGSSATGTYAASGGNPAGYLAMTLPAGSSVGGMWVEAVQLTGSAPYLAEAQLDYRAQVAGDLVVSLEPTAQGLNFSDAAVVPVTATGIWTTTPVVDVSNASGFAGTYYFKVAFLAQNNAAPAQVGIDNVKLGWITDAYFYLYLPLPLPYLLWYSWDQGQFLAYYGFLIGVLVLAAAWYSVRERKRIARAFTAPLDNISTRLRSMSAWVAVAQVWLAGTFFQFVVILVIEALGAPVTSPITTTPTNAWTDIFQLTAASVWEEVAFRLFLIGVPMAVAALLYRLASRRAQPVPGAPGKAGTSLRTAWHYLWGGNLRRESPQEAKLAAAILIPISAFLWAIAHAAGGGWGWWKVVPVFVMGLGAGYIYVRHGLGAAILLHFATDGSLALSLEGVGGAGLDVFTNLFYIGLAIAGSGFLAWYVLYGWEEFKDFRRGFQARIVRQPIMVGGPGVPPGAWGYAPPSVGVPGPSYPYAPPPPPPPAYAPPPQAYAPPPSQPWPQPPVAAAPPSRGGMVLPQGYSPTYHPPPYGYPPVRFQCPYCGWVEARYENRSFTCLRCGRTA